MMVLFTTSKYPASWLIRNITKEDCSHVALYDGIHVLHCTFTGVKLQTLAEFQKHNKVLHTVALAAPTPNCRTLYEQYKNSRYDFGALCYLGLRYLIPYLPKANLWQTSGMFLCTEFATKVIDHKENSLLTPHQLYDQLLDLKP